MSIFEEGQQVEVYSGDHVLSDETGEPFWYPAIVTAGPFPTRPGGEDGYYVLGVGPAEYPFDQYSKLGKWMRRASEPRVDLACRYVAFMQWSRGKAL